MVKKVELWTLFNVSLDLLLFMNAEVQNVKHMNEKSSQRGINGFNILIRQNYQRRWF